MLNPKLCDLPHLLIVEHADAMWWSKKTVSDYDLAEVVIRGIFVQPILKGMLENMCTDLYHRWEFAELPFVELLLHLCHKLSEYVQQTQIIPNRTLYLWQFQCVRFENLTNLTFSEFMVLCLRLRQYFCI